MWFMSTWSCVENEWDPWICWKKLLFRILKRKKITEIFTDWIIKQQIILLLICTLNFSFILRNRFSKKKTSWLKTMLKVWQLQFSSLKGCDGHLYFFNSYHFTEYFPTFYLLFFFISFFFFWYSSVIFQLLLSAFFIFLFDIFQFFCIFFYSIKFFFDI